MMPAISGMTLMSWNRPRKYHSGLMPAGVTSTFAWGARSAGHSSAMPPMTPRNRKKIIACDVSSSQKYGM